MLLALLLPPDPIDRLQCGGVVGVLPAVEETGEPLRVESHQGRFLPKAAAAGLIAEGELCSIEIAHPSEQQLPLLERIQSVELRP